MTDMEKKAWNLKEALALEEETHDWFNAMNELNINLLKQVDEAKRDGNSKLVHQLEEQRIEIVKAIQKGYSSATKSKFGLETLELVRARRKNMEEYISGLLERQKE